MKNKYQRMTKEEKNILKEKYYKTEKGKEQRQRFIRLKVYGILGIILSVALLYLAVTDTQKVYDYIVAITLLIVSIIFIAGSLVVSKNEYNKFALKQK